MVRGEEVANLRSGESEEHGASEGYVCRLGRGGRTNRDE